ncbi:cytochrome P450 [Thozetella sp. PMI_491]|nr:cytochrome P450 [Thozetella sp. PMI_491]
MLAQIFTPSAITLLAAVEWILAPRLFPALLHSYGYLQLGFLIFLGNYATLVIYNVLIYPVFVSPLRHLRGPKTALMLMERSLMTPGRAPGDMMLDVLNEYPDEELILLNAARDEVLVAGPRALADLLTNRAYDFTMPSKFHGFLKAVVGEGLLMAQGDQHRFLRKVSQPAFSFRHVKGLYSTMWDKARQLVKAVKAEVNSGGPTNHLSSRDDDTSGVIEFNVWTSRATLDIIGIAGLGREFNSLAGAEDPLLQVYEELLQPSKKFILYFLLSGAFGLEFLRLFPWKVNDWFRDLTGTLETQCQALLEDKKEKILKQPEDHSDILSILMRSNALSEKELTGQVITYLLAGHETSSAALTWSCYLLSKHQNFQEIVRQEVKEALLGDESLDSNELASILEQLPYLNAVINETLRLYPPAAMIRRECIRESSLVGYTIPAGAQLVFCPWATNRSTKIWGADAAEFRPERWIADGKPNLTGNVTSNYDYLTFSHGPRSCIGQGFAKAELRCLLAAIIRSFSWELALEDSEIIPTGLITIKPANGLRLRMKILDV